MPLPRQLCHRQSDNSRPIRSSLHWLCVCLFVHVHTSHRNALFVYFLFNGDVHFIAHWEIIFFLILSPRGNENAQTALPLISKSFVFCICTCAGLFLSWNIFRMVPIHTCARAISSSMCIVHCTIMRWIMIGVTSTLDWLWQSEKKVQLFNRRAFNAVCGTRMVMLSHAQINFNDQCVRPNAIHLCTIVRCSI